MSHYESPTYEVIKSDGPIEIRQYEAFYTSAVDEQSLSGRSGFGVLFSYISGQNKQKEKMAMTIPVINEFSNDTMSMEFVIPKKYANKEIPNPLSPNVQIKHYPARKVATYRFSGRTHPKKIALVIDQLHAWLKENHIESEDYYILARYNPPFSLPMLRRNEVHINLK
ncbi:MAG: SOUL family heme-binding protein [Acholeplasmataceae bacterium]